MTALTDKELVMLEKALCATEGASFLDKPCLSPVNTSSSTPTHNNHESTTLVLSPCSLSNGFSNEHLVYEPVTTGVVRVDLENRNEDLQNEDETLGSSMKDEPPVVEEWNENVSKCIT